MKIRFHSKSRWESVMMNGLLAAFLIFQSFHSVIYLGVFHLNRNQITEAHCINKNRPELNCKGSCHLKKVLESSTDKHDEPGVQLPENLIGEYLPAVSVCLPDLMVIVEKFQVKTESFILQETHDRVFHPPRA